MEELQINQLFKKFRDKSLNDNELVHFVELIKSVRQGADSAASAKTLINNIDYFDDGKNIIKVKKAQSIVFREPAALQIFDKHEFDRLHYMPSRSKSQRAKKRELKAELKMLYRSSKMIKKMFPDGIEEPDEQELIDAFNMPETNSDEKKAKKLAVKAAQRRLKMFRKASEPHVEAKKLIEQYDEYKSWKNLESRYHELKNKVST